MNEIFILVDLGCYIEDKKKEREGGRESKII